MRSASKLPPLYSHSRVTLAPYPGALNSYPGEARDNWQVMPWLVGLSGTAKDPAGMQLAKGRGDRCCVEYTTALRDSKRVIYDMAVSAV